MHETTDEYLLQIEPQHKKSEFPVEDDLTRKMEELLSTAEEGTYQSGKFDKNSGWRGFHICVCGEWSGNKDLMLKSGHITNSLAAHYLRWHREDVPESEIQKLKSI